MDPSLRWDDYSFEAGKGAFVTLNLSQGPDVGAAFATGS
jgi:hypothetical protein